MRDDVVDTTALASVSGMADLSSTVLAHRYRLGAPLGQGAMADVYRAEDMRLGRDVAVKLFHPGQEDAVRVRFGAEAQALARLSHPGLISIFDAGVDDDDRPYLVMQLVDGESLRDRLLAGPLTADDVVSLGMRLSAALAHVHGNGVVHRDIKPSNIVLDEHGAPHLADFGIALLLDAARMTGSNEILGTAAYLAPEQILGEPVDASADVYSLGLVLLECLTGELEYPGVSKVESALARLHRPPRVPADLSPVLAALLTSMTARMPADRPTAAECAARLWAVQQGVLATSRFAGLTRWLHRPRLRTGWRRFAIAGSGLAIAIVASAWMMTSLLPRFSPPIGPSSGTRAGHFGTTGPRSGGSQDNAGIHVAAPVIAVGPGYNGGRRATDTSSTKNGQTSQNGITTGSSTTDDPTSTTIPPETTGQPMFGPNPGPTSTPTAPTTTEKRPGKHKDKNPPTGTP
ncbi:MAG TPA: serine/threonine-protein kinase [Pseudonocardiaceae bacterium]|jgi:serine/threonine protein kinase|nr:serine/threonine-protein kinase [Pseudonocardiaceae bacterium]